MAIELREVKSQKDLKAFVLFPFSLYKHDKYWVPPLIKGEFDILRSDINPAFEHCEVKYVLAYKDGKVAGRIAGIINHMYNSQSGKMLARFSWFDFIDDKEVSGALLHHIEKWALAMGMNGIIGPMGFTTFDRQGILVEGFDELPTISSTYNYKYYPEHLESFRYQKKSDYLEFEIKMPDEVPEKSKNIAELIEKRYKLKPLRTGSRKELNSYGEEMFKVLNAAYGPILGFVPLTSKQIKFFLKNYFSVIQRKYITAVMDEHGRMVGFQIAMPSLSRAFQKAKGKLFPFGWFHMARALKNPDRIDLLLVGVLPEYQGKGVNVFFMNEIIKSCLQKNISFSESNGLLEENTKIQYFLKYFETRQHKRRRLYFKALP